MKKKTLLFLIFPALLVFTFFSGCYYDAVIPEVEVTPGVEISFNDDIIPIFNAGCNTSGCHNTGEVPPDLTAANAYNALINGAYIDLESPDQSELYRWVNGKGSIPMPIAGTDPQIASDILTWISQGAENN